MSVGSEARPAVDAPTGMGQGPAAARAGSFAWFARHEIRLALRDWARPGAEWRVAATAVVIAAALHLCAYGAIGLLPLGDDEDAPSRLGLDLIISFGLVSLFAMMVAQAPKVATVPNTAMTGGAICQSSGISRAHSVTCSGSISASMTGAFRWAPMAA